MLSTSGSHGTLWCGMTAILLSACQSADCEAVKWGRHFCLDLRRESSLSTDGESRAPESGQESTTFEGTMVGMTTLSTTTSCSGLGSLSAPEVTSWLVRDDMGGTATVSLATPEPMRPPPNGAKVWIDYQSSGMSWTPWSTAVVRVENEPRFSEFYSSNSRHNLDSRHAGFYFSRGEEICHGSDECGSWTGYSVKLSSGTSRAVAQPGTRVTVGELTVLLNQWTEDSGSTKCADWRKDGRLVMAYVP